MFVGRRLTMNDREMLKNIEAVVEKNVRPALRSHGGDVELLSYTDGICRVRLLGKCRRMSIGFYYDRGDHPGSHC